MIIKDETYYFHQTPKQLAKELVDLLPLEDNDILYEPFKGEGAFYDSFPLANKKIYTEILEGLDYKDMKEEYDWVITNPPFKLPREDGKKTNAVWELCQYYSTRARKGIAFLINYNCVLTPNRLEYMKNKGFVLTKLVLCSIKKWRGRYYFMVFEKKDVLPAMLHLTNNY